MRPGSGVLSVQVLPDGPTRVLQISDFNQRRMIRSSPSTEQDRGKGEVKKKKPEQELEVLVNLEEGVGVSLVNKVPEELVFTTLSGIDVHFTRTAANEVLELSIQNIQVDNQLLGSTQPVMLCVTPSCSDSSVSDSGPALQVNSVKVPSSLMLTYLFKHLMVTARRFTVIIEEKLLLKLLSFFGYGRTEAELETFDENIYEKPNEESGPPKRYYFENLKISLPQVKLSVFTSHKLPPDLKVTQHTHLYSHCPFLVKHLTSCIPVIGGFLFVFVVITLLQTSFTDPGILPRATPDEAADIEKQIGKSQLQS
ncbi:vacuolar protein sorting-associated protein 13D-like [Notothenia coriiceps]|uniref:Vacuolar protein sorting-associated protein 13D-like n=1 Tax=Notothenia coriiceps TaxID=8208 RepID=A0A6I9NMQ5_9TELE|nr:PREDICTED: vacuolar protein sorting-associated protein 13D-like [Notothenia coriiceps]